MTEEHPFLSIVVIGLNEAAHLEACLRSAQEASWPSSKKEVLYVDSGSTDGSMEIAQGAGVRVLRLEDPKPNASKGRNLGWKNAQGELVQFLDGDMELHPDWLERGWTFLEDHPDVGLVAGIVSERHPENIFCRLFQLDWGDPKDGPVQKVGGAALYRMEALKKSGGFDPSLGGGEEPELCWRLRNHHGFSVWFLAAPMTTHDLQMDSIRQWWRRAVRDGKSFAAVSTRFFWTEDPLWRKPLVSILAVGSCLPLALLLSFLLSSFLPLLVFLLALGGLIARKTLQWWKKTDDFKLSLLYALHVYLVKFPLALGAYKYLISRIFFKTSLRDKAAREGSEP